MWTSTYRLKGHQQIKKTGSMAARSIHIVAHLSVFYYGGAGIFSCFLNGNLGTKFSCGTKEFSKYTL
jgi:hypothetical protein